MCLNIARPIKAFLLVKIFFSSLILTYDVCLRRVCQLKRFSPQTTTHAGFSPFLTVWWRTHSLHFIASEQDHTPYKVHLEEFLCWRGSSETCRCVLQKGFIMHLWNLGYKHLAHGNECTDIKTLHTSGNLHPDMLHFKKKITANAWHTTCIAYPRSWLVLWSWAVLSRVHNNSMWLHRIPILTFYQNSIHTHIYLVKKTE